MKTLRLFPVMVLAGIVPAHTGNTQQRSEILTRQVLLPTGLPAIGARVTLETFDENQKRIYRHVTSTNAQGQYSAPRVKLHYSYSRTRIEKNGYAPVIATRIPTLNGNGEDGLLQPLILLPAFTLRGYVKSNGRPVVGATVGIGREGILHHWLNALPSPWTMDWLDFGTTRTTADGSFTLPGIVLEDKAQQMKIRVVARTIEKGGQLSIGAAWPPHYPLPQTRFIPEETLPRQLAPPRSQPYAVPTIDLQPVYRFSGRLRSGEDGRGLAGVPFHFPGMLSSIGKTGTDGKFEVWRLASDNRQEPLALSLSRRAQAYHHFDWTYRNPKWNNGTNLQADIVLPPLVPLTGELILETNTNLPLSLSFHETSLIAKLYDPAFTFQTNGIIAPLTPQDTQQLRARFSLLLPVGQNHLSLNSKDFKLDYRLDVPRGGLHGLVMRAQYTGSPQKPQWETRQVLLPEGSPAANVPVWLFSERLSPAPLRHTVTDVQGKFEVDLTKHKTALIFAPANSQLNGDTSLGAMYQGNLNSKNLQLKTTALIRGTVQDKHGQPIAGAHIARLWAQPGLNFSPTNIAQGNLPTPLHTRTDARGVWEFPLLETKSPVSQQTIFAALTRDGVLWSGGAQISLFPSVPADRSSKGNTTLNRFENEVIRLRPTITFKGRVLEADGKPAPQVQVSLSHKTHTNVAATLPLPSTLTGSDGRFALEGVPILAALPQRDWTLQANRLSTGNQMALMGLRDGVNEWPLQREITLQYAPSVLLSGRVVDAYTGQPVGMYSEISAWQGEYLPGGLVHTAMEFRPNDLKIYERLSPAPLDSQGRFSLWAPSASNTFTLRGDWRTSAYEDVIAHQLPPGPQSGIVLKARRKPGVIFQRGTNRRLTSHSGDLYNAPFPILLEVRQNGTVQKHWVGALQMLFIPTAHWGERIEYRVLLMGPQKTEYVLKDWATVKASLKQRPVILNLPVAFSGSDQS